MIQHFYHECSMTSLEFVAYGICNLCYKDKHLEFSCCTYNIDLCEFCAKLPQKVSHDFHSKHPVVFCLGEDDRKPRYVICSGCGNMCPGSFYECKECEVYLDLECATEANVFRSWDIREMLPDSYCHLLRRCKAGPDARGSCLLCESPISPSAICYGCVHCYLRTCGGKTLCGACKLPVPFGCLECCIDFHLRCANSLLRGLKNLMTRATMKLRTTIKSRTTMKFHFDCLEIPEYTVK